MRRFIPILMVVGLLIGVLTAVGALAEEPPANSWGVQGEGLCDNSVRFWGPVPNDSGEYRIHFDAPNGNTPGGAVETPSFEFIFTGEDVYGLWTGEAWDVTSQAHAIEGTEFSFELSEPAGCDEPDYELMVDVSVCETITTRFATTEPIGYEATGLVDDGHEQTKFGTGNDSVELTWTDVPAGSRDVRTVVNWAGDAFSQIDTSTTVDVVSCEGPGPELRPIESKAIDDHGCDPDELGVVITQIEAEELAPPWVWVYRDGAPKQKVLLSDFTGHTAHYVTNDHLDKVVTRITAEIYIDWDGQFNLSHGPCEVPTTTTTTAATTTTSGDTTTTTTAATTTTSGDTTTTTTSTTLPEEETTTTAGETTTTSDDTTDTTVVKEGETDLVEPSLGVVVLAMATTTASHPFTWVIVALLGVLIWATIRTVKKNRLEARS